MTSEKNIFTKQGYKKLQKELEVLKTETRTEIANKLNEAAGYGDLSENAAYQAAMEQRDMNEARIIELEDMLGNAKIVESDASNKDGKVSLGDNIVLEDEQGQKIEFQIVGTGEEDVVAKKFNVNTPLVSAIIGKKEGDKVSVELPMGKKQYKIIKVK